MPLFAGLFAILSKGGLTALFGKLGFGAFARSALALGASLLANNLANRLLARRGAGADDMQQSMAAPTTEPAVRHVYGECWATGTPIHTPTRDGVIYGVWLLNSRPSALPDLDLSLDKRDVAYTGDPFDFAGAGAEASTAPFADHVRFWIGRGDQTAPPDDILAAAPWGSGGDEDLYKSTDGFRGCTVIWIMLTRGRSRDLNQRWPSYPNAPLVEVLGRWSNVWDPREVGQDGDDPATWTWSRNHALVLLDAHRQNPVRSFADVHLDLASFSAGATWAGASQALNAGGTELVAAADGTIDWSEVELEDALRALADSGGVDLPRTGGRVTYLPATWRASALTITDVRGPGLNFSDMLDERQLINTLRASYVAPGRRGETAWLQPWSVPDALTADSGVMRQADLPLPYCHSPTQAMRIRKLRGLEMRRQRSLSLRLPAEAVNLTAGDTVTVSLPDPLGTRVNGVYQVDSAHPMVDPLGDGSCALEIPVVLIGPHAASIYAWTPAADEETVVNEPYDGARDAVPMPGTLAVTTGSGVDLNTGGTVIPRVRFAFDPAPGDVATGYEWEYRASGGIWEAGGLIDGDVRDGLGDVFGHLIVSLTEEYDIRVRTVALNGLSDWRSITGVLSPFVLTGVAGVAGLGAATFTGTAPATNYRGVKVYRATVGAGFGAAVAVSGVIDTVAGASFSATAGDPAVVNLIANGGFATDTVWTKGDGWTISGGVAVGAATVTSQISQTVSGVASGNVVRIGWTITAVTAGSTRAEVVGATTVTGGNENTAGRKVASLTAPASPTAVAIEKVSAAAQSIDDVAAFVQTAGSLAQGAADFFVVPVSPTGIEGAPSGPFTLIIT